MTDLIDRIIDDISLQSFNDRHEWFKEHGITKYRYGVDSWKIYFENDSDAVLFKIAFPNSLFEIIVEKKFI